MYLLYMPRKTNKKKAKTSKAKSKASHRNSNINNININIHDKKPARRRNNTSNSKKPRQYPVNLTPQVIYKPFGAQYSDPKPTTAENQLILKKAEEDAKRAEDNVKLQKELQNQQTTQLLALTNRLDEQVALHNPQFNEKVLNLVNLYDQYRDNAVRNEYNSTPYKIIESSEKNLDYNNYPNEDNVQYENPIKNANPINKKLFTSPPPTKLNTTIDSDDESIYQSVTNSDNESSVNNPIVEEEEPKSLKEQPKSLNEQYLEIVNDLKQQPHSNYKNWKPTYLKGQITKLKALKAANDI